MENGTDNKIVELFGPKAEPKDTQAIDEKMQDAWTPGVEVEFDPDPVSYTHLTLPTMLPV